MTYAIAAAGTGGHVYPGLAVGEALVDAGVPKEQILFVGGDRLEASVYPESGFPFLGTVLKGLNRSKPWQAVSLPGVVRKARNTIAAEFNKRSTRVVLGMGGYVTVPSGMAAKRSGSVLMLAEQNADAGLANRVAARWASRTFVSFPDTRGLEDGEWAGNPVRRDLAAFDREALQSEAHGRYSLDPNRPTLGVFGGSLGAGVINEAVSSLVAEWSGPLQVVHLGGASHVEALMGLNSAASVVWRRIGFEDRMDLFYAASDLVVARSGGGVAELTATGTPAVLVPGEFGSAGHQHANAKFLVEAGAACLVSQDQIDDLQVVVRETLFDPAALKAMSLAAKRISRPKAASTIAHAMLEAAA